MRITDDDAAPQVLLSVDVDEVSEGDGATIVRVRAELSNESRFESDVVVSVSAQGSGVEGAVGFANVADFDVTIPAGGSSGSASFTLTPTDDAIDGPDEVMTLSASKVVPAGLVVNPGSLSIMLLDDDAPAPTAVRFSGGGFAAEDDASSSATVFVWLGRVLGAGESLRVPLAVTGTGVEAGDVTVAQPDDGRAGVTVEGGGTLTPVVVFTGSGQQGVQVDAAELMVTAGQDADTVHETVAFGLAAGAAEQRGGGVVVGEVGGGVSGSASVLLVDDDAIAAAVLAWPGSVSLVEGDADAGSAQVQVRLSEQPSGAVAVTAASWDALAVRVSPASLTFSRSDWDEPQSVTVTAADDTDTDDESVLVSFTAAGHTPGTAGVSVADDVSKAPVEVDAVFAAMPGDLTLAENSSGPVDVGSPVTATDANDDPVTYSLEGPSQAPASAGFVIAAVTGQISYTGTGVDREDSPQISLVVVATSIGADGTATSVRQAVSVTVTDVNEGNAHTVTVAGVAVAGRSTLRFVSVWGDPDGDPAAGSSYQWQTSASAGGPWVAATGAGARTASYSVAPGDAGRYLRVRVGYTDGGGNSESVLSAAVGPVGVLGLLNAAVEVTSALGSDADHASDTAAIAVSLDALVLAGETVTVPLVFTGGTLGTDFTLAESGSGVSLSGSSVVFTGPAVSAVTVEVSAASAAVLGNELTVAPGTVAVSGASLRGTTAKAALVGDEAVFTGAAPKPRPKPKPERVPVVVTLARTDSGPISEDTGAAARTAVFTVTLSRVLVAGETVDVPLDRSGAGVTHQDFALSLTTDEANTGVSLRDATSLRPMVRLSDAGAQVASLTITASDDSVDEGAGEVLAFALGDLAAAGLATNVADGVVASDDGDPVTVDNRFELLIVDDEVPSVPVVWLDGVTHRVSEAAGRRGAVMRLGLSPAPSGSVTVRYTVSGTATSGDDFLALSGSLVLSAGAVSASIPIAVLDDSASESAETIIVTLDAGTGYTLGPVVSSTVEIADDDPVMVTLARTDSGSIDEDPAAGAAARSAVLTVTLSRELQAGETVEVPLVLSGTGIAAADVSLSFTSGETNTGASLRGVSSLSPVLRFVGAGAQVASLTVTATDDSVDEGTAETLTVALGDLAASSLATNVAGGTAAGAGANSFAVTVTDDDMAALVARAVGDGLRVSEPSGVDTLLVALASQPTSNVTVTVASGDASALVVSAGGGARAGSVQLRFTPTDALVSQPVTVHAVNDDADNTGDVREVTVTVSSSSSDAKYEGLSEEMDAKVADDDRSEPVVPLVQFTSASHTAGEAAGDRVVSLALSVSPAPSRAVTVRYTVSGTATSGVDFTALSGSVVVEAGASTVSIPVAVLDDSADEAPETIVVTLDTSSAYSLGTTAAATVTVADDDATVVRLVRVDQGPISEGETTGNKANAEFTVTLGRRLAAGEIIEVPLVLAGVAGVAEAKLKAVTAADVNVAKKAGDTLNKGVAVGTGGSLASTVTFTGSAVDVVQVATLLLSSPSDSDTAESQERVKVGLGPDDDTTIGFDHSGRATNVGGGVDWLGVVNSFEVTVLDGTPMTVTVSGPYARIEEGSGDTATATVTLSRALAAGEVVEVPVTVTSNTGAILGGAARFLERTRALRWEVSGTGVTLRNDPLASSALTKAALVVRFEGTGAQTATITFTAVNGDRDTKGETVNVQVPNSGAALNAASSKRETNVAGGLSAGSPRRHSIYMFEPGQELEAKLSVTGGGNVAEGDTLTVTVTLDENTPTDVTVPVRMRTSGLPTASANDFELSNNGMVAIRAALDDKVRECFDAPA